MKKKFEKTSKQEVTTTTEESNDFASSSTMNIKANPDYAKLINSLTTSEYNVLKNSISNKGLHLPIIINQHNVILDGHNRLKICQELGIESKFEVKEFSDQSQEKEFVIEMI